MRSVRDEALDDLVKAAQAQPLEARPSRLDKGAGGDELSVNIEMSAVPPPPSSPSALEFSAPIKKREKRLSLM